MRRKFFALAAGILVPVTLFVLTVIASAQELPLEKILNPVAEYDPFESRAGTAPKFFPDEVDRRARALMIDVLTRRDDALAEHAQILNRDSKKTAVPAPA
jgi:hypothetical protein